MAPLATTHHLCSPAVSIASPFMANKEHILFFLHSDGAVRLAFYTLID
jgi:hypothetical protein